MTSNARLWYTCERLRSEEDISTDLHVVALIASARSPKESVFEGNMAEIIDQILMARA